jgi:hypothetical protein
MQYSFAEPPPPTYSGPRTYQANFNIAARQGEAHLTKRGTVHYLPLTGVINVKGAPCFSHGVAEAGLYSTIEGDIIHLRFQMDDGSQLNVSAVYTDPAESGVCFRWRESWVENATSSFSRGRSSGSNV